MHRIKKIDLQPAVFLSICFALALIIRYGAAQYQYYDETPYSADIYDYVTLYWQSARWILAGSIALFIGTGGLLRRKGRSAAALSGILAGASIAVLIAAGSVLWNSETRYYRLISEDYLLVVFWPLIALFFARISQRMIRKERKRRALLTGALYFLCCIYGIWAVELLSFRGTVDMHLTEIALMVVATWIVFAGEIWRGLEGRTQKISAALSGAAVCLAGAAVFLFVHPDIAGLLIHSGQRLPDGSGSVQEIGWLQYRLQCIKIVLAGGLKPAQVYNYNPVTHFEGLDSLYISWSKQPLLSVYLYQRITFVELLVLFGGMMLSAAKMRYKTEAGRRLAFYMRSFLWLAALSAFVGDFMLVTEQSGIGTTFPLIGSGIIVLPLLLALYLLPWLEKLYLERNAGAGDGARVLSLIDNGRTRVAGGILLLLIPLSLGGAAYAKVRLDPAAARAGYADGQLTAAEILGVETFEEDMTDEDWQRVRIPEGAGLQASWEDGSSEKQYGWCVHNLHEGYGFGAYGDSEYFGNYENDKPNGYGVCFYRTYSMFGNRNELRIGRYEEGGMKEGFSVFYNSYDSNKGRYEDKVVFFDKNGQEIDLKSNPDVIHYESGALYYGEVREGRPDGYGLYCIPDQEQGFEMPYLYIGEFRSGKQHGEGMAFGKYNTIVIGTWEEGMLTGHGVYTYNAPVFFAEAELATPENSLTVNDDGSWFYQDMYEKHGTDVVYLYNGEWRYSYER